MSATYHLAIFTERDEDGVDIAHFLVRRLDGDMSFVKLFEISEDVVEEFVDILTGGDWDFNTG